MKSFTNLLICIIIGFKSLTAQIQDSITYLMLEPHDFHLQLLMTDTPLLIDVREPFEFRAKRIADAVNIPSSGNIEKVSDTLNNDFTLFLYCSTDYRSIRIAEKLYEKGFRKLVVLKGGIVAWRKDKMPVIRGRKAKGARR